MNLETPPVVEEYEEIVVFGAPFAPGPVAPTRLDATTPSAKLISIVEPPTPAVIVAVPLAGHVWAGVTV